MPYFLCFIFLITSLITTAQKSESSVLQAYQTAQDSLFLLKNEAGIVPLQDLEHLSISAKTIGLVEQNSFNKIVQKYSLVDTEALSFASFRLSSKNEIAQVDASKTPILLLAMSTELLTNTEVVFFIKNKAKETKIILACWGERSFLQQIDPETALEIDALIWHPNQDEYAQSLAAQAIFGGTTTSPYIQSDALTIALPPTIAERTRLGYAPPIAVGMDSAYLHHHIDSIVNRGINEKAFPGAQVLVAKDGKVVFHKTYGYHTYEGERPVQQEDIYDLASVSKITTALPALMRLHGEGKFDLDAPFKQYFSKQCFRYSNKKNLIWREILAHQARLYPWIPYWKNTLKKEGSFKRRTFSKTWSEDYPVRVTPNLFLHKNYKKKIYRAIRKSKLNEKEGYKYSGLAFYLLPEMLSDMVQDDFETHLKKTFYEPLGAHTMTYNAYQHFPLTRIVPTERDTFFRMNQLHGYVHDEGAAMMGGVSSNAGLFASANDLAKLAQMYLNKGTYGGKRFIATETMEEFTRCQFCDSGNRRGLGFDKPMIEYVAGRSSVAKSASPASYGHAGYTGTFLWIDPEANLLYIFFSNRVYPSRDNRKLYQLDIRPSIHQVLYDAIVEEE